MADDTDVRRERRVWSGLFVAFGAVAGLALLDLLGDLHEGLTHLVVEGAIVVVASVGVVWAAVRARRALEVSRRALAESQRARSAAEERAEEARDEARALAARLEESRLEAARWKQDAAELIGGLGAAIDRQLERWGLSPAEKEVALLLLKGLSHREVAEVRAVGEATVRQQARAIYKKAGLDGRHDLAAFFLEDLLTPRVSQPSSAGAPPGGPGA